MIAVTLYTLAACHMFTYSKMVPSIEWDTVVAETEWLDELDDDALDLWGKIGMWGIK